MAHFFLSLCQTIHKICAFFGRVSGWLVLALVLVIVTDVTLRRWFVIGSTQLQELEWHLHGALFLLAMGWAYQKDAHVRIGLFSDRLNARGRACLEAIGIVLFLMPYLGALIYFGIDYVWLSITYGETSASPTGLPYRFVIKSIMVWGFALLMLAGIGRFIEAILFLTAPEEIKQQTRYCAKRLTYT